MAARVIFFTGWALSPMTSWNDAFINIPLAYFLASMTSRFFPEAFSASIIAYYWLTNIVGIVMTYIGAREMAMKKFDKKDIMVSALTMVLYTLLLAVLSSTGIMRPFLYGR